MGLPSHLPQGMSGYGHAEETPLGLNHACPRKNAGLIGRFDVLGGDNEALVAQMVQPVLQPGGYARVIGKSGGIELIAPQHRHIVLDRKSVV